MKNKIIIIVAVSIAALIIIGIPVVCAIGKIAVTFSVMHFYTIHMNTIVIWQCKKRDCCKS